MTARDHHRAPDRLRTALDRRRTIAGSSLDRRRTTADRPGTAAEPPPDRRGPPQDACGPHGRRSYTASQSLTVTQHTHTHRHIRSLPVTQRTYIPITHSRSLPVTQPGAPRRTLSSGFDGRSINHSPSNCDRSRLWIMFGAERMCCKRHPPRRCCAIFRRKRGSEGWEWEEGVEGTRREGRGVTGGNDSRIFSTERCRIHE